MTDEEIAELKSAVSSPRSGVIWLGNTVERVLWIEGESEDEPFAWFDTEHKSGVNLLVASRQEFIVVYV